MIPSIEGLLKLGLPALLGFPLGLLAIAYVEPITQNGRILLMTTVIVLTILVWSAVRALVGRIGRRSDKDDDGPK